MTFHRFSGALGAAVLVACSAAALAHAILERPEAVAESAYRGVIQIMHGCKGSPTTAVSVTIPDGAIAARPMAKQGWTVTTARGPYRRAYPAPHGTLAEGVKTISWSGGTVPPDQFDEFVFSVRLSDDFKPGDTVHFPVEQTCESGRHRWVEIPAAGQDRQGLAEPAPAVRIVAATQAAQAAPMTGPAPSGRDASTRVGDLTIEAPWMRATPKGASVAAGYLRITNRGTVPDRLVSTSIPLAGRGEVHEMSNEGGIMRMRPVEGGLAIRPGETVELKPGGFHLMFLDLRSGVSEGEAVQGTLTFEKAGTVAVTFRAAGIGARAPASGHSHH